MSLQTRHALTFAQTSANMVACQTDMCTEQQCDISEVHKELKKPVSTFKLFIKNSIGLGGLLIKINSKYYVYLYYVYFCSFTVQVSYS